MTQLWTLLWHNYGHYYDTIMDTIMTQLWTLLWHNYGHYYDTSTTITLKWNYNTCRDEYPSARDKIWGTSSSLILPAVGRNDTELGTWVKVTLPACTSEC